MRAAKKTRALGLLVSVAAACTSRPESAADSTPASTPESAQTSVQAASSNSAAAQSQTGRRSGLPPGVVAALSLEKASVPLGEPVNIRLVLRNRGARAQELRLVGSPAHQFDLMILDSAGREVWSRLHGEDIDLDAITLSLAPGDSLVVSERWAQRDIRGRPAVPGTYIVRAYRSPRVRGDSGIAVARLQICGRQAQC